MAKEPAEVKEQPQVTVRGIPQNKYNENVAAQSQQPGDDQQGGIEGHFKKHWVIYTLVIGAATLLAIIWFSNNQSNASNTATGTGYDTSGTSAAADTYGASLDSDYQQLIQQGNTTNSLLQQLLNGTPSGGTTGTGTGSSGSGSSSGGSTSGGKKKKKKSGSTSSGSSSSKTSSGGSSSKSTKSSSSSTSSKHSVSTSHSSGKTTVKPNPTAGGAHGYVYTTKKGDTVANLTAKAWPGSNNSGGKGNPTLWSYANNKALLKGNYSNKSTGAIKPGTKIVL
jgi:hypothetical protein